MCLKGMVSRSSHSAYQNGLEREALCGEQGKLHIGVCVADRNQGCIIHQ